MLIRNIPQPLRRLAILRTRQYRSKESLKMSSIINRHLITSFEWSCTQEGALFWYDVSDGKYLPLKKPRILKYVNKRSNKAPKKVSYN